MSIALKLRAFLRDPRIPGVAAMLLAGGIGGFIALWIGLPLPFMLGGLFGALPLVVLAADRREALNFPQPLRRITIGMIGAMIGGTVTPDILGLIPALGASLAAMLLFVPLAQGAGYVAARRVGGYDRATALYASMPGGLIEAVELGRANGADVEALILGHFLRIVIVIVAVPLGFSLWSGHVVGSAGGQGFALGRVDAGAVPVVFLIAVAGVWAGMRLRLPAAHLVGPMVLSAGLHGASIVTTSPPDWLLMACQLVVGASLAAQFTGAAGTTFRRVLRTTLAVVAVFAVLGVSFALGLHALTGLSPAGLILSFAPGGVTEMGLIALSLSLSPVIVSAHHVLRIFWTVTVAILLQKFGVGRA